MHRTRHPFFEGLVFGLFGLLAVVVLAGAAARFFGSGARRGPPVASAASRSSYYGQDVPEGGNLVHSRTERAVNSLPASQAEFGASEGVGATAAVPAPSR